MSVEIPLSGRLGQSLVTLVDDEDAEWISRNQWRCQGKKREDFYVARCVWDRARRRSVTILLHREILGLNPGDGLYADHESGDKLDNRRSNLRVATSAQNAQNRTRLAPGKTSRYRGVYWYKRVGKWLARCQIDGKTYCIGYFSDEDEAGHAVSAFRREHMPFSAD